MAGTGISIGQVSNPSICWVDSTVGHQPRSERQFGLVNAAALVRVTQSDKESQAALRSSSKMRRPSLADSMFGSFAAVGFDGEWH